MYIGQDMDMDMDMILYPIDPVKKTVFIFNNAGYVCKHITPFQGLRSAMVCCPPVAPGVIHITPH